jgi:hypothetical protein
MLCYLLYEPIIFLTQQMVTSVNILKLIALKHREIATHVDQMAHKIHLAVDNPSNSVQLNILVQ